MKKDAVISPCEEYRYRLTRTWDDLLPSITFLMMNPSTADAAQDDATIRKCIGFAQRWGYGGIEVVNLFAYRSRDPKALLKIDNPIGPDNGAWLVLTLCDKEQVICAWGCEDTLKKGSLKRRAMRQLHQAKLDLPQVKFMCLGLTQGGTPRHPLMLAYTTPRVEYNIAQPEGKELQAA